MNEEIKVIHRKNWSNRILGLLLVVIAAIALPSLATNKAFQWDVFANYFLSEPILRGMETTLVLTFVCFLLACALGTVIAVMRMSSNRLFSGLSWTYSWFFRATPILVQLLFWYNMGALYPRLSISLPFGPSLASVSTNQVMTAALASVLGLGLAEAALMAEIIRSGIQAVSKGQVDAAAALSLTPYQTFRRVIAPQALRIIVPPSGNEILGLLKMTTLVSILAMSDLLFSAQNIYTRTFQPIPLLAVATVWYLILTSILMVAQHYVERRLARSDARRGPAR